jgi:putative selenate reductase molybdopterin-binding subunit
MELELSVNGVITSQEIAPNESLITLLRLLGCSSVKCGCETGDCGACTILVDGVPRPSCVMLAAQAGGCSITTVENIGHARNLHPLQQAFIDVGATQCGFCTPGMLLSAHALLKRNPSPTESEVRDALSGNLCRCSGYEKPVQAVLRAATILRGQVVEPLEYSVVKHKDEKSAVAVGAASNSRLTSSGITSGSTSPLPILARGIHPDAQMHAVGKPVYDRDATKMVTGKPVFAADAPPHGTLYGRVLTSPHAHAVIRSIDISRAKALPGVHAVLTYQDMAREPYSSVPTSPLEQGLRDRYPLDYIMRYVGDRVAAVAAETPELAEEALRLINVEYEVRAPILDLRKAMEQGAPIVHPEAESQGIYDAKHNIAARVRYDRGDVEHGFKESDVVVEGEYLLPLTHQALIEKYSVITYFDENDDLVVRTSMQSPAHIQNTLAHLLNVPMSRIHVVPLPIGGGDGGRQEIVLEDLCALLTIASNRPVMLTHSRQAEFESGGARAQYALRLKTGVKKDGTIVANQMVLLANTGAYGSHPLIGQKGAQGNALALYPCQNMRFVAEILYSNLPPVGAYQGYGVPQEAFAMESHLDEVARRLDMDALELRRKNWINVGDEYPLATTNSRIASRSLESSALEECVNLVAEKLDWRERRGSAGNGRMRRGVGMALSLYYAPAALAHTGGAIIKLNEDGSFTVITGCIEDGSGTKTMLAQLAAEVLQCSIEDVLVQTTGTEVIALDAGASPSATFYVNGEAILKAAEQVRRQILTVAGRMLGVLPESLKINSGLINTADGQKITLQQVAIQSLYAESRYIMAAVSAKAQRMPMTFAAQGVEVEIDTETGTIRILKAITAVDTGRTLNPLLLEGQVQRGASLGLGMGMFEELLYDQKGALFATNLRDYHLYNAVDIPELQAYLVESVDPLAPFGAKSVAEVTINGMAPALANAVADALGTRISQLPLTPERVLRAVHASANKR